LRIAELSIPPDTIQQIVNRSHRFMVRRTACACATARSTPLWLHLPLD
jgi:hypothetical protein